MANPKVRDFLVVGGLIAAGIALFSRRAKAAPPPPTGPQLEIPKVEFFSPGFTPGSAHTGKVLVKNVGLVALNVADVRLLVGDFYDATAGVDAYLVPGATREAIFNFTIPTWAFAGTQVLYSVFARYDSKIAERRNQPAFTIEAPVEALLDIAGVSFAGYRQPW